MAFAIRMKSIRVPVGQLSSSAAAYVIADSAALADALATAYMVMGEEFAFAHAEERV